MELPPPPKRSDVSASRLNLDIGTDSFLVSILEKATTPRKDHWDLNTDANCLAWFYSHIKIPARAHIDPWDALDIEDFKPVDISIPSELSCVDLVQDLVPMTTSQVRKRLNESEQEQQDTIAGTNTNTPSPGKQMKMKKLQNKRRRQWEKKMYPSTYVAPLHDVRVADSINILTALRKLVQRRELHIKMMREAVDLDWWRVISEDWKATVRLLTCEIIELVHVWRVKLGPIEGNRPWSPKTNLHLRPFRYRGKNYLLKIPTDLDFMTKRACYGSAQRRNPFLLPFPLEALHEIAAAEPDQESWGCRISRASAALLKEEKRCGSFIWDEATRTLKLAPNPSAVLLADVKQAFRERAKNWERKVDRRGLSHDGSEVSAVRGSTVGTLGMLKSRGGRSRSSNDSINRNFESRQGGGGSPRGGSSTRGRDIFTPGSNNAKHSLMTSPPRTPTFVGAISITDKSVWDVAFGNEQQKPQQQQLQQPQQQQPQQHREVHTPISVMSTFSDDHHLYPPSERPMSYPETPDLDASSKMTAPHRLEPIIFHHSTSGHHHNDQPPTMLSSLELSPFGNGEKGERGRRTIQLRPKGRWTPKGYDSNNGFSALTSCPLADCLVCDALRVERRVAVYTAKSDRRQRVGLYNAMMNSRISILRDMSAIIIQGLWRGALVRQNILRPMYHEEFKVTSDLGGTRMTTWLPNAHATAIQLQRLARVALSYWELLRRRQAELERIMAVRIQSRYRIRKSQHRVAFARERKRVLDSRKYLAAVGLQNAFRSRKARRVVCAKLEQQRKSNMENDNADIIQRGWRCSMARYARWLRRAILACIAIQASFRRSFGVDEYRTKREMIKMERTCIQAAHVRLDHLKDALLKAEQREVDGAMAHLLQSVDIQIQQEVQEAAEKQEAERLAAEVAAFEKRTGRKPLPQEISSGDASHKNKMMMMKKKKQKKKKHMTEKTLPLSIPNHALSRAASENDVRVLTRYLFTRSSLPTPSENVTSQDMLSRISHFDDRQVVTRLKLDEKTNEGDDFIASRTISDLKSQIQEVEEFIETWRLQAFISSMRKQIVSRYVGATGRVPVSIQNEERKHSVAVAVFQHAHIRTYAAQNVRDNLAMFRRHLIDRESERKARQLSKIQFSKKVTENWLQHGFQKAETIQRDINQKHDRMILDKEESFIIEEDLQAKNMRSYLTSTSYARVGVWETFSTLFDAISRRELYIHRNKSDKRKIEELDDNAILPPMEEDGAIIVEHVTIPSREFQEFTRRIKAPVDNVQRLSDYMSILDEKNTGRVPFERACWWYFSGSHSENSTSSKERILKAKSMAKLFMKRKRVLLYRWNIKTVKNLGPIKSRIEKRRKKRADEKYSAELAIKEAEQRRSKVAEALLQEEQEKEQEKEDKILEKIRYANDAGDEIWRSMRMDPPYEKHIRPPLWSVELALALKNSGIITTERKPIPVEDSYIKGAEDTDDEKEEEEEWEKKAKALAEEEQGEDEKEQEGKDEKEKKTEKETNNDGDGDGDGNNSKDFGTLELPGDEEKKEAEEANAKKDKEEKFKKRKPKVFAVPYVPRIRPPGNELRVSGMLSRGLAVNDLKKSSEKYRKELRKRKKKRDKELKKQKKEREKLDAMTPEERLDYRMEEQRNKKQGKQEARKQAKKEKEEKDRLKRERRKEQKLKRGGKKK